VSGKNVPPDHASVALQLDALSEEVTTTKKHEVKKNTWEWRGQIKIAFKTKLTAQNSAHASYQPVNRHPVSYLQT
jgi:hypothetical protein